MSGSWIDVYSGANSMLYQAVSKPLPGDENIQDTLTNFYWLRHDSINGYPDIKDGYWVIDSDQTNTNADDIVLDNVETFTNPDGWWMGDAMWEDSADMPFRLAVRLKINSVNLADSDTILSVIVTQRRHSYSFSTPENTICDTFNILHCQISTIGDVVMIDPKTFTFPHDLWAPNNDTGWQSDVLLTVHSKRYCSVFSLFFVAIMDSAAFSLRGGIDINQFDGALIARSNIVHDSIIAAANYIKSAVSLNLKYLYLYDYPVPYFSGHNNLWSRYWIR